MLTVKAVLSSYLLVILAIVHFSQQQPAIAAAQPLLAQSQPSWTKIITTIFGGREPRDPGPVRRGGPRPPDLCWITPIDQVWQTRPTFVWRGGSQLIGVRKQGEETVLWQKAASINKDTAAQTTPYVLESPTPLPPGKYEWLFFDQTTRSLRLRVPFEVLDSQERTPITAELAQQEAQLKQAGAGAEEIALHQANVFAQHQLWSDAIQTVYSVKNPSVELQQTAQKIEQEICDKK